MPGCKYIETILYLIWCVLIGNMSKRRGVSTVHVDVYIGTVRSKKFNTIKLNIFPWKVNK